jgi:hypothetical protein
MEIREIYAILIPPRASASISRKKEKAPVKRVTKGVCRAKKEIKEDGNAQTHILVIREWTKVDLGLDSEKKPIPKCLLPQLYSKIPSRRLKHSYY